MALILKWVDVPCCYHSNETTLAEILCGTNLKFYTKKIEFFCEFFSLAFSPYFSLCHIVIYKKKINMLLSYESRDSIMVKALTSPASNKLIAYGIILLYVMWV